MRRLILAGISLFIASTMVMVAGRDSASAADTSVTVGDIFYSPNAVTIQVGDTVTWNWTGSLPHNVTADDGSFNSGAAKTSGSFAQTFNTAGTFSYFCSVHGQAMTGTVTVATAGGTATTPAAGGGVTTPAAGGGVTTPAAGGAVSTPTAAAVTTPLAGGGVTTPTAGGGVTTVPSTGTGSDDGGSMPALVFLLGALGVGLVAGAIALRRMRA